MFDRHHLNRKIQQHLQLPDQLDLFRETWVNPTPRGGLRLTDQGLEYLVGVLQFDYWQFNIDALVLTPKNLLLLDRYLTCPYHLKRDRAQAILTIFGSAEAMMANLYGDIEQFISNLES